MTLSEFNRLNKSEAREHLLRCCGSRSWADELMNHFPFGSKADLKVSSDRIWFSLTGDEWKEAFAHHPEIGSKSVNDRWASEEQSGASTAEEETKRELLRTNKAYKEKFGYIFIVCATGKSAEEMLKLAKARLNNDENVELQNAAMEQNKITHIRLDKLIS